jgi:site-specific recombinase XerD
MKTLTIHLEEYLTLRHKLGFKLRVAAGLLSDFVLFTQKQGASVITAKLALKWATQPADCQPAQWANRLGMVRRFALYVSGSDPRTEIPSQSLLPQRFHRKPPYQYNDSQICNLIGTLRQLPVPSDLRSVSNATLLGLLAVTGMRVGEAIGLDRNDVDLEQGLLTVRHGKHDKSRLVPIHQTTQKELRKYERLRDRSCPHPNSSSFFLSERGTRLTDCTVRHWFIVASRQIGLRSSTDSHGPRIHDLRHRFASKTILDWYRCGADVEAQLPKLTTYLGHGHVADTYWYISATPELLQLATQRLERQKGEVSK